LPVRPGQEAADSGEQETIGGLPAGPANLALEHSELVSECEHLGLEPGRGRAADDQDLQQEVYDGVEEG
jgi:hypothetical protein